eukprot:4553666-Lingulodinium_polyedra.AAC.1
MDSTAMTMIGCVILLNDALPGGSLRMTARATRATRGRQRPPWLGWKSAERRQNGRPTPGGEASNGRGRRTPSTIGLCA